MSLHAGMLASLTAAQVLLRTMLPMGLVMALASLMPCDEPEASTTASNACKQCRIGHRAVIHRGTSHVYGLLAPAIMLRSQDLHA